jgi:hypothetical protein
VKFIVCILGYEVCRNKWFSPEEKNSPVFQRWKTLWFSGDEHPYLPEKIKTPRFLLNYEEKNSPVFDRWNTVQFFQRVKHSQVFQR